MEIAMLFKLGWNQFRNHWFRLDVAGQTRPVFMREYKADCGDLGDDGLGIADSDIFNTRNL